MNAYIFDVDGVLTSPKTKRVTISQNLKIISSLLEKGNIVSLITGRALAWIEERVVALLEKEIKDNTLLQNVYISGEFGYNTPHTFHTNPISPTLIDKVKILAEKYKDSMMIDPLKTTMISIEMHDGYDLSGFEKDKKMILPELEDTLNQGSHNDLEITHDIIAINIKSKKANKGYATRRFLEWLKTKNLKPQKYIAFGDSIADFEIAEEINNQNLPAEFVFVGADKNALTTSHVPPATSPQQPFPVVITKSDFESGTLEYLSAIV